VESPPGEIEEDGPSQPAGVPAEGAPPEREDWYRTLLKYGRSLLCTHNLQGRLLSASTGAATLLGYSVEELLQIPMLDLIDPSFRSEFAAYLGEIQRAGEAHGLLAVMTRSGGRRIWEYHNTLQTEGVETPIVLGLAHDVTEQRLAQMMLQASEQRFRAVYDKSSIGFSLVNPQSGRILQVNAKYCEITGRSEQELKGLDISSITHPDDVAMTIERLRELAKGRTEPFEVEKRYVRPDGSVRWVNLLVVPMWAEGKPANCVMGVLQDITDRKQAEEALLQSEAHLRRAQAVAHMGSWRYDIVGNALTLSDELYRIIGLPAGTAIAPEEAMEFLAPEDHERIVRAWTAALESGHLDQECWVLVNGDNRLVHVQACVGRDAQGRPVGAVGTVQDITEQKEAEEALRQSEGRYRSLFEKSIAGVAISTLEGELIDCNDTWARMLGYTSAEEVRGQRTVQNYAEPGQRQVFVDKLRREGTLFNQEMQLRRKDGTLLWALTNATLLPASHHGPLMQTTFTDITDRKQAEEALRQTKEQFQLFIEHAPAALAMLDREMRYLCVSRRYLVEYGRGASELRGVSHYEIFPAIPERWKESHRRGLAGEVVREENDRFEHPDGRVLRIRWEVRPWYEANGEVGGIVIFSEDITERKRAELALLRAEEVLRLFIEHAPASLAMFDRDMGYLQVSRRWRTDLRLGDRDLRGLSFYEVLPEAPDHWKEGHRRALAGEVVRHEYDHFERTDGSVEWVRWEMRPWYEATGKIGGIVIFAENLTERERAAEALRESEARLRLAQEAAKIGVFERNLQTDEVRCSPEMCALFGLDPGQSPRSFADLLKHVHPQDQSYLAERVEQSIQTGEAECEWRVVWPDGSVHWIAGRWHAFKDDQGRPARLLGMDFDITERKRAEEALRASEQRLKLALQAGRTGVFEAELESGRGFLTPEAARIWGAPADAVGNLVTFCWERTHPDDLTRVKAEFARLADSGAEGEMEFRILRPTGETRWVRWRAQVIRDARAGTSRAIGVNVDITERKQAEEALQVAERKYREVFENVSDSICLFDVTTEGGFQLADLNAAAEKLGGVSNTRAVGKYLDELVSPEILAYAVPRLRECVETCQPVRYDEEYPRPDGQRRYLHTTLLPVCRDDGTVGRVIVVNQDITELHEVAEQLRAAKDKLTEEKLYLEEEINAELGFEEIIGRSKALRDVMEQVAIVAHSDATVLLLGETGTGKELVARAVHQKSKRQSRPFIKMNCAAIPSGLLESELFGYEKGAFTGATGWKAGRLELADKGTLFLDEIGEISLALQPKLLRLLQDHEFERLGGTRALKSDFRLIAATNRDLLQSVNQNQFRKDLFYRLNVFPIRLPSLRERREDIPLLVEHFVRKLSRRLNKSITSIPQKTMELLRQGDWPGNIRELENFLERSVILTRGSVLACPVNELRPDEKASSSDTLKRVEREHILKALRESGGQLSGSGGAAARLGLKRTTLQSKLRQFGIDHRQYRDDRSKSA